MKRDFGVGQRIREVRQALSLTQDGFARAIGVSKPALVRYEAGLRLPRPETLLRIGKISGKPVAWFFSGSGDDTQLAAERPGASLESRMAQAVNFLAPLLDLGRSANQARVSRLPPRYRRRLLKRLREVRRRLQIGLRSLRRQAERELAEYRRLLEAEWEAERRKRR